MWFQDEARIGRKNAQPRIGARKGTRPRRPADRRSEKTYLFAAIRPKRGTGAALVLPKANTEAMQPHLDEIAKHIAHKAHGVVLRDRAGWRGAGKSIAPKNPTVILPPPKSPETEPGREHPAIPAFQRPLQPRLSDDNAIVDAACDAWNAPIDTPRTIASIACRDWTHL